MRYVQLLSGFVGASGGFAGLVLPLSKCLVTGIPRLTGSSREKEYPSLTVRAYNGLSWDTPAWVLSFESRARGYEADWNLLISGCREFDTRLN